MNFGDLIAKGGPLFLRKKLSAVQQVFDEAPAGEKATFQALVLGDAFASSIANQQLPLVISHRGDCLVAPETTISGYDQCMRNGVILLEMDVKSTSDGVLVAFHDGAVDALTDGTGAIETKTWAQVQALTLDTALTIGPAWSGVYKIPKFSDILTRYSRNGLFIVEDKTGGLIPQITAACAAAGISPSRVMIQHATSLDLTALSAAVALGYTGMFITDNGSNITGTTLAAANVRYLGVDYATFPQAKYEEMKAAGIKVIAYTVSRRSQLAAVLAKGGAGVFSNDASYTSARTLPSTVSSFHLQKFVPGMHGSYNETADTTDPAYRGVFTAPDYWGYDTTLATYRGCLQGNLCPVANPNDFTFDFRLTFDAVNGGDSTRWASVFIGETDACFLDAGTSAQGYHFLIRQSGALGIYSVPSGSGSTSIATGASTTLTIGTEYIFRITVKPSTLTVAMLDAAGTVLYSLSATSALWRGGYITLGRAGAAVRWRDLVVVSQASPDTITRTLANTTTNLGVGTATPLGGFHLAGKSFVTDNTFGYYSRLSSGGVAPLLKYNASNQAELGPNAEVKLDGNANLVPPGVVRITPQGPASGSAKAVVISTPNEWAVAGATLFEVQNWGIPKLKVYGTGAVTMFPQSSFTPPSNGELAFEATSNTTLTLRYKGSDGVVRSVALTLT